MLRSMAFFAMAAAGSSVLSGCSTEAPPARGESGVRNRVEERLLTFYNWFDYVDTPMLSGFEEETGITVKYHNYSNVEQLLNGIGTDGGGYDLIVPGSNTARRLIDSGALMPLDHGQLPLLGNLEKRFREADFDPGNKYSVPWAWGTTGLAFSSDEMTGPVTGYSAFNQPGLRARCSILYAVRETMGLGLIACGHDPNTHDTARIEEAGRYLINLKHRAGVLITSDVLEPLVTEDFKLVHAFSGDAFQAKAQNREIQYVIPEEGSVSYVDLMCIPKGAPHALNAHRFINFLLRGEVAAGLANAIRYASPNAAARPLINRELLANKLVNPPPEMMTKLPFIKHLPAEVASIYSDVWSKVISS